MGVLANFKAWSAFDDGYKAGLKKQPVKAMLNMKGPAFAAGYQAAQVGRQEREAWDAFRSQAEETAIGDDVGAAADIEFEIAESEVGAELEAQADELDSVAEDVETEIAQEDFDVASNDSDLDDVLFSQADDGGDVDDDDF